MAEVVAGISLAASIAGLIDVSTKLASRLSDLCSKCPNLPENFRQLASHLPLLKTAIQRVQVQTQASGVPQDIAEAVLAVIEDTSVHGERLEQALREVVPQSTSSRAGRVLVAMKSFKVERRCKEITEEIRQNLGLLTFYQQAINSDNIELIRKLMTQDFTPPRVEDIRTMKQKLGLVLGTAPTLEPEAFIGRESELDGLHRYLSPEGSDAQRLVSIVGIGGVGKTQLSLAYACKYAEKFSSIFWLDAGEVADSASKQMTAPEDEKVQSFRSWLAEPWNHRWLLIFDNHDNPKLPGNNSLGAYDLRSLFPSRAHGRILISTRSADLTYTKRFSLMEVKSVDSAIELLSQRASRDMTQDQAAEELVLRLKGLPLALATAGSLLRQTSLSCAEYLHLHNSHWISLYDTKDSELLDYGRTLASTWMISAEFVTQQDPDAFELLKYLAYFSKQDIWYDLIAATSQQKARCPAWMRRVTATRLSFDRAMKKLVSHSLVDVIPGSYRLHPCLHDWLSANFNYPPSYELFLCAAQSVHRHLSYRLCNLSVFRMAPTNGRLLPHLRRLRLACFHSLWISTAREEYSPYIVCTFPPSDYECTVKNMDDSISLLGPMLEQRKMMGKSIDHNTAALAYELGTTLRTVGRYQEAEQPLKLALQGFEQILGPDDPLTLACYRKLGQLYGDTGAAAQAEKMLNRAISSVRALKDRDMQVSGPLLICYTCCLFWRARLAKDGSKYARSLIRDLIQLAQTTRNEESFQIYNYLGIMLKSCNDDANAHQALRRNFVEVSEGVFILPNTGCDGCLRTIFANGGWHVCGECPDIDLCHACKALYPTKVGLVTNCQGHTFFEAGAGVPLKRSQIDPWLKELVNIYC